jgi:hypothetical protein
MQITKILGDAVAAVKIFSQPFPVLNFVDKGIDFHHQYVMIQTNPIPKGSVGLGNLSGFSNAAAVRWKWIGTHNSCSDHACSSIFKTWVSRVDWSLADVITYCTTSASL